MVIKYPVGTVLKSNLHLDSYYCVKLVPILRVRKDKKIIVDNPKYTLEPLPDNIHYKSKYDGGNKVYKRKNLIIEEPQIDSYIESKIWSIL